ncbi:protein TIFY 8-like [Pyrus ussuriensis x Pyrus communis]|uniref:Protein TIFY 8-like n=1 Tax=Pyrus ussuriensis x Pyrus communis TaxID=2448454 RepID=A0A5N5EXL3_9ROSA|nr:protein TIFY 8-like [Pyrus ussuriensis x Pyrus communis]
MSTTEVDGQMEEHSNVDSKSLKSGSNSNATTLSSQQQKQQPQKQKLEEQQQGKHTIFHDFLGMKPGDSPVVLAPKTSTDCRLSEPSPSAS